MPQMVSVENELIRINPRKNTMIEYSTNNGSTWGFRCNSNCGQFKDLCSRGKEIIACTTQGIYYSTNRGSNWACRYYNPESQANRSSTGKFEQIISNGNLLIATTNIGVFHSSNGGSTWFKKS